MDMKVLHIVSSLSWKWGGPTAVVVGLSKSLAQKGVDVSIFAPSEELSLDKIVRPERVEVRLFRKNIFSKIWAGYSINLARTLKLELDYFDLIHIHGSWNYPCYVAYRAAKKFGKPYIITTHGTLDSWCLNHKRLKKKIYAVVIQKLILEAAKAIHAITIEEAKHIRNYGIKTPISVIPNGIEPAEYRDIPLPKELEKIHPELAGKKVVLFLGRIHPKKGLDLLAKAFGKIVKDRSNVMLIIAGPDSKGYKDKITAILESMGVLDKTIFTGLLTGKEKLAVLNRADVFVLPSHSEGFSIAILEAMMSELPVIITHQCHFPEVAKAKAGIIIEPDVDQLTIALLNLLDNAHLRKIMGENGQQLILKNFTWDKIAGKMVQLYKEVL